MAYTTAADVRTQTPFKNTTSVTNDYITQKIAEADSIINSKVGDIYVLPLAVSGVAATPDIIEFLSKEIAVALLYMDQFSEEIAGSTVDGSARLDKAMLILDAIQTQKEKLLNASGVEFDRATRLRAAGYPTASSTEDGDTSAQFTMAQKF